MPLQKQACRFVRNVEADFEVGVVLSEFREVLRKASRSNPATVANAAARYASCPPARWPFRLIAFQKQPRFHRILQGKRQTPVVARNRAARAQKPDEIKRARSGGFREINRSALSLIERLESIEQLPGYLQIRSHPETHLDQFVHFPR